MIAEVPNMFIKTRIAISFSLFKKVFLVKQNMSYIVNVLIPNVVFSQVRISRQSTYSAGVAANEKESGTK